MSDTDLESYIAPILGAEDQQKDELIRLYVPNADKDESPIADHDLWCERVLKIFNRNFGGATCTELRDGIWHNEESKKDIKEQTKIVYSFTDLNSLLKGIHVIREIMHVFGEETNQGEVVFELRDKLYSIKSFSINTDWEE